MVSRREAVPFAFLQEAESFRSNVTPPPKQRPGRSQFIGRTLVGLSVVAGLVGSLLFGLPALEPQRTTGHADQSVTSERQ